MKSKKKFLLALVAFVYVGFIAVPVFAASKSVAGMNFNYNTYYVPPITKVGTVSLSGHTHPYKSVTACVGSCSFTGMKKAFEVSTSHAGFSWNTFNASYDYHD